MTLTRKLNNKTIPALGLGCWAIGGPFYSGETPLGWGNVDDAVSMRAINAAVDAGIRFFDTAQAYGCGHSEIVLGKALKSKPDVQIGTKVGYAMDPQSKQLTGEMLEPLAIKQSIDQSLERLRRDHIDIVHLHLNEASIKAAGLIFDTLADLRKAGKVLGFGWSTDFPDHAATFAQRDGFVAIQHAMNVFYRADMLIPTIEKHGLLSINRSPLAMGLLGGKHSAATQFSPEEVRGRTATWMDYFEDGKIRPEYAKRLSAIRELLQSDCRSLAQGAISWLWARSNHTLPIPGFRSVAQVEDLAGALRFGPLSTATMVEIEGLIDREPEGAPRSH